MDGKAIQERASSPSYCCVDYTWQPLHCFTTDDRDLIVTLTLGPEDPSYWDGCPGFYLFLSKSLELTHLSERRRPRHILSTRQIKCRMSLFEVMKGFKKVWNIPSDFDKHTQYLEWQLLYHNHCWRLESSCNRKCLFSCFSSLANKAPSFFQYEMSKWFEYIYFFRCCVSQWPLLYPSWRQKSPISNLHSNVWGLLEYIEAWSSSPRQLMWKENFINSISKKKTLPISCVSFLASGLKGISRALLSSGVGSLDLSWIRGAYDASAQRKVVFQQLRNQWWRSLMHMIYQFWGARSIYLKISILSGLLRKRIAFTR